MTGGELTVAELMNFRTSAPPPHGVLQASRFRKRAMGLLLRGNPVSGDVFYFTPDAYQVGPKNIFYVGLGIVTAE